MVDSVAMCIPIMNMEPKVKHILFLTKAKSRTHLIGRKEPNGNRWIFGGCQCHCLHHPHRQPPHPSDAGMKVCPPWPPP